MTQLRRHILPPQTTPLERAVDQTLPAWDWMAESAAPAAVRRDPEFVPWLAVDWQVSQFAPYFDSVPALLSSAIPWLMQRGNPASVRAVLNWLGFDGIALDEDESWLHLDLGRLVQDAELKPVAHVVRASIPAHVKFYRVFHGWDLRPIRTDSGRLDDALLDDDSGVWVDVWPHGNHIKVSQGELWRRPAVAAPPLGVATAQTAVTSSRVIRDDLPLLDNWRLDSQILVDVTGGATGLQSTYVPAFPRLQAVCLPPVEVTDTAAAWLPGAPATAQAGAHVNASNRANDDARAWSGAWDSTPWRPSFQTRTTVTEEI
ncbi:MAG: phage tail protein [Desulfovibrionaceae bacterium]|nr:phage tail protein [Desulfovibrionaceae bacterium]